TCPARHRRDTTKKCFSMCLARRADGPGRRAEGHARTKVAQGEEEGRGGGKEATVSSAPSQYERHVVALLSAELRKWFNGQVTIHEGGSYPGLPGGLPRCPSLPTAALPAFTSGWWPTPVSRSRRCSSPTRKASPLRSSSERTRS